MSSALSAFAAADRSASPAAGFAPLGRLAAAATLVVGAAFQVIAFTLVGALWIASSLLRAAPLAD